MANLSEDIQCADSDTRPPMLDRTDFASWQQRIRLYCQGKENGVNILKSIDEGPFQMGTFRETLAEGDEGALHLGPEQPRVYSDLSLKIRIASPHQAASIAKCSATKQALPNTTDAELGKPEVAKEVGGRKVDRIEDRVKQGRLSAIAQTMFMANLSSADPVYDETDPLYDLDILSE
ncbi:hypothetical protein Tco_1008104, partial [Tanacetum coccineum]